MEPGAGERPVAVSAGHAQLERFRGLFDAQAGVKAELDELAGRWIHAYELLERFIQSEQFFRGFVGRRIDLIEGNALAVAPSFQGELFAGAVDENATHGLGGGREEMPPAVPALRPLNIHEP